jgi:lactaldehyde reductase
MVCVDQNDIPILAIIDAEMMLSMPKSLTAATGMDALTHAIEGYTTKAWSLTDMFALQSISMISKSLKKVVDSPMILKQEI